MISTANSDYFAMFGGVVWGGSGCWWVWDFFLIIQGYGIDSWYNDKSGVLIILIVPKNMYFKHF